MGNRKHERKAVSAPARLVFSTHAMEMQLLSGQILDICEGGIGLDFESKADSIPVWLAERGLRGELLVQTPDGKQCEPLPVETVWFREEVTGGIPKISAGLRFPDRPGLILQIRELIQALPRRWKPVFT